MVDKENTLQLEIKYGIIIGMAISCWILLEFLLGFHTSRMEFGAYSGYFAIIIPLIGYYKALKAKKKSEAKNFFTIGRGLKSGFTISIIVASVLTVFLYLYTQYLNPNWNELSLNLLAEQMKQSGSTPAEINEIIGAYREILTPRNQAMLQFLGIVIEGLIISLIMAVVIRRKSLTALPNTPITDD